MPLNHLLAIGFTEGFKYSPLIVGATLLFRLGHYPDLGIEGSFLAGGAVAALCSQHQYGWFVGLLLACFTGAVVGAITGSLYQYCRINSLLSGIATSYVVYSTVYVVLKYTDAIAVPIFFSSSNTVVATILICLSATIFFSSRLGMLCRFSGESPNLVRQLHLEPKTYICIILIFGNLIVAFGGWMRVHVAGSFSMNVFSSNVYMCLIAMILGDSIVSLLISTVRIALQPLRRLSRRSVSSSARHTDLAVLGSVPIIMSGVVGSIAYWVVYEMCTGTRLIPSGDLTFAVLGVGAAAVLVLTKTVSRGRAPLGSWRFLD